MIQTIIYTILLMLASAFILQNFSRVDKSRIGQVVMFVLLVAANYYLAINAMTLYETFVGEVEWL